MITVDLEPRRRLPHGCSFCDAPEHQPALYYESCGAQLHATREVSSAGNHIILISALFGLLKEEGLKCDDEDGGSAFFGFWTGFCEVPAPRGYEYDWGKFALTRDLEYVQQDFFQTDFTEYARKHEAQLRLWSLVGRIDTEGLLGAEKPGSMLLQGLEDPVNRAV
ncbi:hypothetical protein K438DRAFT_1943982 [Mycena galopus ATCC 62051]|nr:hypothetical protein K438DRAFT_1943982 [Mycena galopus ATCC 62051]